MSSMDRAPACSGLCCTKIENFSVTIGRNEILWDINLHIHCGELTALIGPNGAGKSTLLKAILGEVRHTGTLAYLDEKQQHTAPLIGYVPQHLGFDAGAPVSVLDLFVASRSRFPAWLAAPGSVRRQAQKSLARAEADHLPDLLLLDEPVSGVDQKGLELFYRLVSDLRREYDLSIILVSHDLGLVSRFADRVILLNGTIRANGTPEEVYASPAMAELFGLERAERRMPVEEVRGDA